MITLRLAANTDLEFMRLLRNQNAQYFFHKEPITEELHQKWWKSFTGIFFIILYNKTRVGTISLHRRGLIEDPEGYWEIGNVVIAEKYRRKGVLSTTIRILKREYDSKFVLQVRGDNRDAINAYSNIGFKIRSLTMEL